MIPPLIKKLAAITAVTTLFVTALLFAAMDWRVAVAYGVSGIWMLGNLFVLAGLLYWILSKSNLRTYLLPLFIVLKITMLGGGVILLATWRPNTPAQALAIMAGVSTLFLVVFAMAIASRISGDDMSGSTVSAQMGETE